MNTTTAVRKIAAPAQIFSLPTRSTSEFREPQQVTCPETGETAMVKIDCCAVSAATFAGECPGFESFDAASGPALRRGCLTQLS